MKMYKFSASERTKLEIEFVNMFLTNRQETVNTKWFQDFKEAYSAYLAGMQYNYSIVPGWAYGILQRAHMISQDYRQETQKEYEERLANL